MHPIAKLQLGNTDSLIINTRSNRQLVESRHNAVYLKLINQKDSNDRSLALRDKPRLGVGIQNISNTGRGLSNRRAKLLSMTRFRLK